MEWLSEELRRKVIASQLHQQGLLEHQLNSFNEFLTERLQQIVSENNMITSICRVSCEFHVISFDKVNVHKPMIRESSGELRFILPSEARLRNLSYSNQIRVHMEHKIYALTKSQVVLGKTNAKSLMGLLDRLQMKSHKRYESVLLAEIPTMVHSVGCHLYKQSLAYPAIGTYDHEELGGYFIVNGKEKVIISQEKRRTNALFVEPLRHNRFGLRCEIRSVARTKLRSTSTLSIYLSKKKKTALDVPEIYVAVPFLQCLIPIDGVAKMLGVGELAECAPLLLIAEFAGPQIQEFINQVINRNHSDRSREDWCTWIGKKGSQQLQKTRRDLYVEHVFQNEFLPHIGFDTTPRILALKRIYLCYALRRTLGVYMGQLPVDDPDDIRCKRLETCGVLLGLRFRQLYRNLLKSLSNQVQRASDTQKYVNILGYINDKRITAAIKYALSTGNWGLQKSTPHGQMNGGGQTGVAQVLSRINYVATLSHLRRVNVPLKREGKVPQPRQLHPSHWGILCCAETPEGAPCGLVKNLALGCHVRLSHGRTQSVQKLLTGTLGLCVPTFSASWRESGHACFSQTIVMLNGRIIGFHPEPEGYVSELRKLRRVHDIPYDTTIVHHPTIRTIEILTDTGACLRPLFCLDMLHKYSKIFLSLVKTTTTIDLWTRLLYHGFVEYLDKDEESTMLVATGPDVLLGAKYKYTHMELHPSMLLGSTASLIPFLQHNQSPRNIYGSCMSKQSLGVNFLQPKQRYEAFTHVLNYPQRPLVSTFAYDSLLGNNYPDGTNCIVAIMTYEGWNQEDSIILNRSAVERGLFRNDFYRTYREIARQRGDTEEFAIPSSYKCTNHIKASESLLDNNGYPKLGHTGNPGDRIIGKISKSATHEGSVRDCSTLIKGNEAVVVDNITSFVSKDGDPGLVVKTRASRSPVIGDKLCVEANAYCLTDSGWKQLKDIRCDIDRVATLDVHGSFGVYYVRPTSLICQDIEEEPMYLHHNSNVHLFCTPCHSCLLMTNESSGVFSFRFAEARTLILAPVDHGKVGLFTGSAARPNVLLKPGWLRDLPFPMSVLLYHVAMVFLAGRFSPNGLCLVPPKGDSLKKSFLYDISCHQPPEFWRLGPISNHAPRRFYYVGDPQLLRYLFARSGLPSWFSFLSGAEVREFIAITYRLIVLFSYGITSLRKANILQKLSLEGGFTLRMKYVVLDFPDRKVNGVKIWIPNSSFAPLCPKKQRVIPHWTGQIACLTVPDTHVFFYKRDQTSPPHWTGNSSHPGQKGVVGMTFSQEDLPFTLDGIVPDLIINPHCMPSRMTIGQLFESLFGKISVRSQTDGTPFNRLSLEKIRETLVKYGFTSTGEETMMDGRTGVMLPCKIFIGPVHYMLLKHMVVDKIHARSVGPRHLLTHQPVEGRSRNGGLRFGEMERDAVLSVGASHFLKDRLLDQSDPFTVYVCNTCGFMGENPPPPGTRMVRRTAYCRYCDSAADLHPIVIPYAFKLLYQELAALHLGIRLVTHK